MNKLVANVLSGLFMVAYVLLGGASIVQYVIDVMYGRGDLTYIVVGIVTAMFGVFVLPSLFYALFKVGGSREFYQNVLVWMNKKIFRSRFNLSKMDDISDFHDLNTWKKAKSLHHRAYLKPISIVCSLFLSYSFISSTYLQVSRAVSDTQMSYWMTTILINVVMIFPMFITFIYLNYIFYPWVKMYVINSFLFKGLFVSSEGVISFTEAVSLQASMAYSQAAYVHIFRYDPSYKGFVYSVSDHKKVAARDNVWKSQFLLGMFRVMVLILFYGFSFILGWICVPLVMMKLNQSPETMNYIKYFFAKKSSYSSETLKTVEVA